MSRLVILMLSFLVTACDLNEPPKGDYVEVALSARDLELALLDIEGDAAIDGANVPPIVTETLPTGDILWKLYADKELVGRYQITVSSPADGQSSWADGIYLPLALSEANAANPNLKNAKRLGHILNEAMASRAVAADPTVNTSSREANLIIANQSFTAVRMAANSATAQEFVNNDYARAGQLMDAVKPE